MNSFHRVYLVYPNCKNAVFCIYNFVIKKMILMIEIGSKIENILEL